MTKAKTKTKTENERVRNTPVRRGLIYCAPFCGGRCTYAAFKEATRKANAAANKMGLGWKADVFENLGWHWRIVYRDGQLKVHPSSDGTYSAYLGKEAGHPGGRWVEDGATPRKAVAAVLSAAYEEILDIQQMLDSVSGSLRFEAPSAVNVERHVLGTRR